jgi:hypothetical protein
MIRIILIGVTFFLLTSCSLPGTEKEGAISEENSILYEETDFSMMIPKTWSGKAIESLPTPRMGSVRAAFLSTDARTGYANNLVILSDTLTNLITSKRYSELNSLQTRKNYLEYVNILEENFTYTDGTESRVYVFEARYNETTPTLKFIQSARVCGTKVYLIHFTLGRDRKSESYIDLLKTFTCK